MRRKRIRPILLWLLAGGVGVAVVWHVLAPTLRSRRVEETIARFEASPSQSLTDKLARLLDQGAPTREQGERILKAILYPKIIARAAYPLGARPIFSAERPFDVRFAHATVLECSWVWVDGKEGPKGWLGGNEHLDTDPYWHWPSPDPQEARLYKVEVRYEYKLERVKSKATWSWHPLQGPLPRSLWPKKTIKVVPRKSTPHYTCRFNVPFDLKVVKKDKAEKLGFVSNPELDKKMRGAFRAGPKEMSGTYPTPAGRWTCANGLRVKYTALPVAIAFKPTLRLANGAKIPPQDENARSYRARANTSGELWVSPTQFFPEKTGEYTATIILTPDPTCAYEDPAIKAIWNGTLEFPIRFIVTPGF